MRDENDGLAENDPMDEPSHEMLFFNGSSIPISCKVLEKAGIGGLAVHFLMFLRCVHPTRRRSARAFCSPSGWWRSSTSATWVRLPNWCSGCALGGKTDWQFFWPCSAMSAARSPATALEGKLVRLLGLVGLRHRS